MPHVHDPSDDLRRIYLIGICGTAMASLAGMLAERGYEVTGSDEHVYPPMSTFLERLGIPILEGYTTDRLRTLRPDLVVVGNAIPRTNPEAVELLDLDLPFASMPEAIYSLFMRGRQSIVVTGTHGKTTTTSLMAWLLESAKRDPSMVVGGIPINFDRNFKLGAGDHFVIEGDEYNTAFFDKGPKFLHYRANTLIVNNIEFDHADIYDGLDSIVKSFRKAIEEVRAGDLIVANGDDPIVRSLQTGSKAEWLTFGQSEECDVRVDEMKLGTEGISLSVTSQGEPLGEFSAPLEGRHNVMNVAACIAVARRLGLSDEEIRTGLTSFRGIKRRMEVRGVEAGVTVIDDFAHHPTAVATTLEGARARYAGSRIWALFEPRSISSGRKEFEDLYIDAFVHSDRVILGPIFHRERFENRYGVDRMMSVERIVEALRDRGVAAEQIVDFDEIADRVTHESRSGDVVIAMSSGAFGGIHERILERLRRRE